MSPDNIEPEPQPEILEVGKALDETFQWFTDWHGRVRERYDLTSDVLRNEDPHLDSSFGPLGELVVGDKERIEASYIWSARQNLDSLFGQVSVLELNQVIAEKPGHPLIGRFFYQTRNFNNLVAVSFGWRIEESEVLYELIAVSGRKIDKIGKVTRPGVLFPTQVADNATLTRQLSQQLEIRFSYKNDQLVGWDGEVGVEHLPERVVFKDGNIVRRDAVGQDYELPKTLDPIPHIKNFMRHRSKEPLFP